ncbi:hypothetical protein Bca52824_062772 [Brassica carinata]|uniref:Uncharacterized protein n=2 Tax=Brassica TaxID=3705 RepID=A0A8X7U723_BRACI|nr:hypothetical protein Bca52824_062772 [Brassica carinata]
MLFSSGLLRLAGDLTTARRASVNPLEEKRDLEVHGLSETESVAASPGAFLTVLQTLCRRFVILCSAYGGFGSGELLLFADRQGILGFLSSLPTWSVAGLCCFPTACFHTVKLKSLSRLAVVGIPGVGSIVWADAELGHLFRLMRLQSPAQGALCIS